MPFSDTLSPVGLFFSVFISFFLPLQISLTTVSGPEPGREGGGGAAKWMGEKRRGEQVEERERLIWPAGRRLVDEGLS